jgi:hypothetical protein
MTRTNVRLCFLAIFVFVTVASIASAKKKEYPPLGILAASVGENVVLVDPITGASKTFPTGPVAWLFPAPGGVVFAPDLVNSKTTVIDLRTLALRKPIPGVTMPHFGESADRYLVLSKQLLIISYPERALINRFEIQFENPWQVEVLADDTALVVLERAPDGVGEKRMTAIALPEGRVVYRRPLPGDVRHFSVSIPLGLMFLAETSANVVSAVDPATLLPVSVFQLTGTPVDLVGAEDGSTLVVAVARADGDSELSIWKLKMDNKKGLRRKKEWSVPLDAAPVRLAASPDGRHVAVALHGGEILIIDLKSRLPIVTAELADVPRDLVWCDPTLEGPLLPDWSDDDEPTINLGKN